MNKKQKIVIIVCAIIVLTVFAYWLISGGEIFTKTQVLVERKDELFGTTYKEIVDKFVIGLDYSLAISGITLLISGILFFLLKNKRKGEK